MRHLLLVAVCLVAAPALAQTEAEVFDGRLPTPPENQARWESEPAVIEARTAARRHFDALHPQADWEFSVLSVSRGAFTQAGTLQHVVLYRVGSSGRCCPLSGLAVVEDGRLIRNVVSVSNDYYLRPLADIDGDGLNELVVVGDFYAQGTLDSWLSVLEFERVGIRNWGSSSLGVSPCGSGFEGHVPEAQRVTVEPGAVPQFFVYQYRKRGCDSRGNERGAWALQGGRVRLDLTPREGNGAPVELLNVQESEPSPAEGRVRETNLLVEETDCVQGVDGQDALSCSFNRGGERCTVNPRGRMTCSSPGGSERRIQLSMGSDVLVGLNLIRVSDGVVLIYTSSDYEYTGTFAAKVPDGARRPAWTVPVGGFNMAPPLVRGSDVYFASVQNVTSLDPTGAS